MSPLILDLISRKFGARRVEVSEAHFPLEFGDVSRAMPPQLRTTSPMLTETFVTGISIACPRGVERWIVGFVTLDHCRQSLGCTDVWSHPISDTARRTELARPIFLGPAEYLTIELESREVRARCAILQVDALCIHLAHRKRNF